MGKLLGGAQMSLLRLPALPQAKKNSFAELRLYSKFNPRIISLQTLKMAFLVTVLFLDLETVPSGNHVARTADHTQ